MPEPKPTDRRPSTKPRYMIPIRQIVANHNPRNPLSEELKARGWTVFGDAPSPHPLTPSVSITAKHPNLWEMATSVDPRERAAYVKLIQDHDPEIVALAQNIIINGQLEPVEVRDNGKKKDGTNTYTLVFGLRRCLAMLYHWCLLGKPVEPVIEAQLFKGNEAVMMSRAVSENIRKQPNAIEEARAFQYAINAGEQKEDVASNYGISVQTLNNRLALLELDPKDIKRIEEGKLKPTKALELVRGKPERNGEVSPPKKGMRPRKEVEEALGEYAQGTTQHKLLSWVLKLSEEKF